MKLLLKNVRLGFPSLHKKKASIDGGPEKYRMVAIIDPNTSIGQENIKKIEKARRTLELEVFGKSPQRYKEDRCCFKEGETFVDKEDQVYDGFAGMMALSLNSDRVPHVVDKDPSVKLDQDDPIPYAGCYVDIYADVYCMNDTKKGGPGFFGSFDVVQFRKHGEAFGAAAVDPAAVMEKIEDEDDEDDGEYSKRAPSKKSKKPSDDDDDFLDDL